MLIFFRSRGTGGNRLKTSEGMVAIGMPLTRHPPHRSQRALLTYWAPLSGVWRQNGAVVADAGFVSGEDNVLLSSDTSSSSFFDVDCGGEVRVSKAI